MSTSKLTLALIGGTGLTELDEHSEVLEIDTPYGSPSAPIRVISNDPIRLLFLPRHGSPHRFPSDGRADLVGRWLGPGIPISELPPEVRSPAPEAAIRLSATSEFLTSADG